MKKRIDSVRAFFASSLSPSDFSAQFLKSPRLLWDPRGFASVFSL